MRHPLEHPLVLPSKETLAWAPVLSICLDKASHAADGEQC